MSSEPEFSWNNEFVVNQDGVMEIKGSNELKPDSYEVGRVELPKQERQFIEIFERPSPKLEPVIIKTTDISRPAQERQAIQFEPRMVKTTDISRPEQEPPSTETK